YVDMIFEYLCSGVGQRNILKELSLMLLLSFFSLNESFYNSLRQSLYVDFKSKVHCLISENLHEPWSVNKVAKLLNVSSATLKRKLLMENTTFTNIFLDIRMNNALNLLRTTSLSISQISRNSGFRSASHFCSCFKNYFGLSPGKMQKQLKKQFKLNFFEL
ncbi:TPA: helix-turn-helix transcriptional regulator, partial [Salmonella enterica subsp. enterica serovar Adelaide]